MLRRCRTAAAMILVLLCLSGCRSTQFPQDKLTHIIPEPDRDGAPELVGVYVDTTPSMSGYLKKPDGLDNTVYSKCLYELNNLIAGKYDQVSYYRVDTPLWKVTGENVLSRAQFENYYKSSESFEKENIKNNVIYEPIGAQEGYDSRCLTEALKEGRTQDLSMLITDFYENSKQNDRENVNVLIAAIRELSGLDDGKVFGLIGIRSTFSGKIRDSGMDGNTVSYGEDGATVYRPFYIILQGYPEYVQTFCGYMEERLDALGLRSGDDYEASVFCEEGFSGLDYTSFNGYYNPASSDLIMPDASFVEVEDTAGNTEPTKLRVYHYHKLSLGDIPQEDRTLYFGYAVDSGQRSAFQDLAGESGRKVSVDFLPGAEREIYTIPCLSQELSVALWDEDRGFKDGDGKTSYYGEDFFHVDAVYYDPDDHMLYTALQLTDKKFTEGIWRLQWKNVLEESASQEPWWNNWHSSSDIGKVDYSKTERLVDYITPILENMPLTEKRVLDGTVYLNIEEG